MHVIQDLCSRILPVVEVTLNCYERNRQLYPVQDAIHSMQMAFYWLGEAIKEAGKVEENEIVEEGTENPKIEVPKPPTILGSIDQMSYISNQLIDFSQQIENYRNEFQLPPKVDYNLTRGYDNIVEGIFNIQIAKTYYEQTQKIGRQGA